jgi:peptidoglycan hydrolase-like protein with peptidoglycan-binding domain
LTGEEIVTGYFDQAYNKGVYDDKIINLQKMFARLQIYSGVVDGVYTDEVIAAIYIYQTQN